MGMSKAPRVHRNVAPVYVAFEQRVESDWNKEKGFCLRLLKTVDKGTHYMQH